MSAGFVTSLRVGEAVRLGNPGADALTVKVQIADMWDSVRVTAAPGESVRAVTRAAVEALMSPETALDDLVVKLGGFEVLDENASLADAGVRNGSTLFVAHRRRRPVR